MTESERKKGKVGKRRRAWTERQARRLLRAARAEGEKCMLRQCPDGALELVPIIDEGRAAEDEPQEDLRKLI